MPYLLKSLRQEPVAYLFALFAAVFLIDGYAFADYFDYVNIAHAPWHLVVQPQRQFLYSSPLNFILGHWLGLVSEFGFYFLHGMEITACLFCIGFAIRKKLANRDHQLRFISFLALSPLFIVLIKWIGKSDPVLIGGFALCWAFAGNWRLLIASIMILAHREIGTLMCLSLFLLEEKKDLRLLCAVALANGLHLIYQDVILNHVPQSRADYMHTHAQDFLVALAQKPALYVMSLFSWYWIFIILEKVTKKEILLFLMALTVGALTEDFTRDFIMVAIPPLFFHLERVARNPRYAELEKLALLSPLQFQIAATGHVFWAGNVLLMRLFGNSPSPL